MPTIEALLEGERRGLLNEKNTVILHEARKRGFVPEIDQPDVLEVETAKEPELQRFAELSRTPGPGFVADTFSNLPGVKTAKSIANAGEPGSLIGGTIGALASPPGFNLIGGAGGAMGGAAIERYVRKLLRAENKSNLQILKESAIEGGVDLGFGVGSKLAVKAGQRAIAPFRKKVTNTGVRSSRFLQSLDTDLLPPEKTESKILDVLHNINKNALVDFGFVKKFELDRTKKLGKYADDFIDSVGKRLTDDEIGEAIINSTEVSRQLMKDLANPIYERAKNITKDMGGIIDITKPGSDNISVKEFAKEVVGRSEEIKNFGAKISGANIAKMVSLQDGKLSFQAAVDLRSLLLKEADRIALEFDKAPAIGVTKKLAAMVDQSIEKSLSKHSPEALKLWREANNIDTIARDRFNNKLIRRLSKIANQKYGDAPEKVAERIFTPNNVSAIKRIKGSLDVETWNNVKAWNTMSLFRKSTNKNTGLLEGTNLIENMYGRNGLGKEAIKTIYEQGELRRLDNFARALKNSGEQQGKGIGRVWIQLTQASAFVGIFTGYLTGLSVFVSIAPPSIGKLFTTPSTMRWLTEGYSLPPGSEKAAVVFGKLLKSMSEAGIEYAVHEGKYNPDETVRSDTTSPEQVGEPLP